MAVQSGDKVIIFMGVDGKPVAGIMAAPGEGDKVILAMAADGLTVAGYAAPPREGLPVVLAVGADGKTVAVSGSIIPPTDPEWEVGFAKNVTNCAYTILTNTGMASSWTGRLGFNLAGNLTAEVSGLLAEQEYIVEVALQTDWETVPPYDPTNALSVTMEGETVNISQAPRPEHNLPVVRKTLVATMTTDANGKLQLSAVASGEEAQTDLHCYVTSIKGWLA